ncbi:hypothetical protein [Solicola gregarius]|uniref:Uncharacterized protein n=1 Tax=Solicola gregarius TaxID=2908642 RepID=A0AA46TL56_9ACTN|nr:hypothetical protein [Solicola gregarius]UYM07143.1 hypothetical protein L0C25_08715 [Solicola gregarius]
MAPRTTTTTAERAPNTPAHGDGDSSDLARRVRLTAWVLALAVRSAADLVTTRGTRHA